MAIHFWLVIYEYNEHKFQSLDIIWKKHLHINIIDKNPSSPPQFTINCYPYDYISTPSSTPNVLSGNIPYKQWTYIRCMADKYHFLGHQAYNLAIMPILMKGLHYNISFDIIF